MPANEWRTLASSHEGGEPNVVSVVRIVVRVDVDWWGLWWLVGPTVWL